MKAATLADRKDVELEHEAYRRVAELWPTLQEIDLRIEAFQEVKRAILG